MLEDGNTCDYRLTRLATWLMNQTTDGGRGDRGDDPEPHQRDQCRTKGVDHTPRRQGDADPHHAEGQGHDPREGLRQGCLGRAWKPCGCIVPGRQPGHDGGAVQDHDGDHGHHERGDPAASGDQGSRGAAPEEECRIRGRGHREELPDGAGSVKETAREHEWRTADFEGNMESDDVPEPSSRRPITCAAAQALENASWCNVPKLFSDLVLDKRPLLMQICCEKESVLTRAAQQAEGRESAAARCGLWNCHDLRMAEGVRLVLEQIEALRSGLVWLSPPCSAYSPLQRTNQRSEAQKEELRNKRQSALEVCVGCSVVWHHCIQQGIHVAWEWSEKCDAWQLPLIQDLFRRYEPHVSTTKGCQVNLRDGTGKLLQKGYPRRLACDMPVDW